MNDQVSMSSERKKVFNNLWQELRDSLSIIDVTNKNLKTKGHELIVWDATALPTKSHYAPVFINLLETLELAGEIDPTKHILVETTTGNAGSALAYVAKKLGYPVLIFIPEDMPKARINDVQQYLSDDSELRFTPATSYVKGVVKSLRTFLVAHKEGYKGRQTYALNHSRRLEAIDAIAWCLQESLKDRKQTFDYAITALGNGTSLKGMDQFLKSKNFNSKLVGIEPFEAPCTFVAKYGKEAFEKKFFTEVTYNAHNMLGTGGWGVSFPHLDLNCLDEIYTLKEEFWKTQQQQLLTQGVSVGASSSACIYVANQIMQASQSPLSIISILYDPLEKY